MLAVIYGKSSKWLLGEEEPPIEKLETPEGELGDVEFLMRQVELSFRGAQDGLTPEDAKSVRDFINFLRAQRQRQEE